MSEGLNLNSKSKKIIKMVQYFLDRMHETYAIPFEFECNLHAFITLARSVTYIMKKEHFNIPEFNAWYQKKQEEIKNDEMLRFFHDTRNIIIHEKTLDVGTIAHIRKIYLNHVPRGWSFAITGKGEPIWITPEGKELHAHEFDSEIKRVYLFENPPRSFLGASLKDFSVITLCELYFAYLSSLVDEAERRFRKIGG